MHCGTTSSAPADTLHPTTGGPTSQIVGIWRLGRPITTGGDARLFLAQPADSPLNPRWDYVIKQANADRVDPLRRMQIRQCIEAAACVSHPNLICVLDGSVDASLPFVVMPRLAGRTMQQWIDDQTRWDLPVMLWLTRQLTQAAAAMHAAGWVHGDIKPANVMVGPQGHVTLIDLGFAMRTHTPLRGVFRGTPQYAAPELIDGTAAVSAAVDVFAIGRLLWTGLTHTRTLHTRQLEPVADLIEALITPQPDRRPTSTSVVQQLLKLELETLGNHIGPAARAA